ncbi:MAG: RDD family protein [Actinomycetota bacterium]
MTDPRFRVETVPLEARGFQGQPAGLITRVAANVIDLAAVLVALVVCYLATAGVLFLRRGARFSFPIVSYPTAFWAGLLALVVYFAVSWATGGRTYGDRVLGLRVTTAAGLGLGGARATVRAVLSALFPVLLLWVAVSRASRSIQDLVVGTVVIYDWGPARRVIASGDAIGVAVDVASPVAHEAEDRNAEAVTGLDRER